MKQYQYIVYCDCGDVWSKRKRIDCPTCGESP